VFIAKINVVKGYKLEKVSGQYIEWLCLAQGQSVADRLIQRANEIIKPD